MTVVKKKQCNFFGPVTMTIIVQGNHQEVEDEYGDEYYDQDEYDEEGSGAGDEYFEEEEPTEGQKEILELRERLKEQIRRKAKAAASCTAGRSSSLQIPQARDK